MDPVEILKDIYKNVSFRILLKGYILQDFQCQWKLILNLDYLWFTQYFLLTNSYNKKSIYMN